MTSSRIRCQVSSREGFDGRSRCLLAHVGSRLQYLRSMCPSSGVPSSKETSSITCQSGYRQDPHELPCFQNCYALCQKASVFTLLSAALCASCLHSGTLYAAHSDLFKQGRETERDTHTSRLHVVLELFWHELLVILSCAGLGSVWGPKTCLVRPGRRIMRVAEANIVCLTICEPFAIPFPVRLTRASKQSSSAELRCESCTLQNPNKPGPSDG